MIRVVIVDDHQIVADGFERLINDSEDVRVIGKAYSVAGCQALLEVTHPDVVLLDVGLPDGDGIELFKIIKKKYQHIKVLILTTYGEYITIIRALDAGVDGYVLKSAMAEEVLEGIRTVASGKRFMCEEVKTTIQKTERYLLELTRREKELLHLISQGYTLSQQADKMRLGLNTVRNYRQKLNVKLDAHNTAQLLRHAKAWGVM